MGILRKMKWEKWGILWENGKKWEISSPHGNSEIIKMGKMGNPVGKLEKWEILWKNGKKLKI